MKRLKFIVCVFLLSLFSCEKSETTQEEELTQLQKLKSEITILAESTTCEESDDWNFTPIGNKACGGPKGHIAYSNNIDTTNFLKLVTQYTKAEKNYNQKWGIASDCSVPAQPSAVVCVDGNPAFEY